MYPRATIKRLASYTDGRTHYQGNHDVKVSGNRNRYFHYHGTTLCIVNDRTRRFFVTNGGWGTQSTTNAVRGWREYWKSQNYTEAETSSDVDTTEVYGL